jgi:hypothetical protein
VDGLDGLLAAAAAEDATPARPAAAREDTEFQPDQDEAMLTQEEEEEQEEEEADADSEDAGTLGTAERRTLAPAARASGSTGLALQHQPWTCFVTATCCCHPCVCCTCAINQGVDSERAAAAHQGGSSAKGQDA